MDTQHFAQGRQDGQTAEQRTNKTTKGATIMATIQGLGRVGKVAVGTVAAAFVAVIGITLAPTHNEAQARTSVLRVPYEAGWELYDNGFAGGPGAGLGNAPAEREVGLAQTELYDGGWAGGPGPGAIVRSAPEVREAGLAATELYDGGWAGGPPPNFETRRATTVVRVPYEAGWELYDNGFAGGPNTLR